MSPLGSLFWKEWRDARRLVIGSVIGSAVLSVLVHWLLFDFLEGRLVAEAVVPGLIGLFVAAVASDLVAGEVATGRIQALALLPIDISRVWTAKLLFLVTVSVGFGVWVVLLQLGILTALSPQVAVEQFFATLSGAATPWLAATVAVGGTVLFFSTLLERGFAAVLSGCIALGAGYVYVRSVNIAYYGIQPQAWMIAAALGVGTIAFVVGSRIAFTRGPIHHGHKARIGVVAIAGVLAGLLPIGGGVAWAVHAWNDVEPGLASNLIERMSTSPDGRYVAVEVSCARGFAGRNWSQAGDYAARVWVIDLETAELREVEGRGTHLLYDKTPWDELGQLRVWTRESTAVEQDGLEMEHAHVLKRVIDPATAGETERRKLYKVPSPPAGPGPFGNRVDWVEKKFRGPVANDPTVHRHEIIWKAKKLSSVIETASNSYPVPSREPGVVFYWTEERKLVRYEIGSGKETVLHEGKRAPLYGSSDGVRLITHDGSGSIVLDATTGQVVGGPFVGDNANWHHGLPGHRYAIVTGVTADHEWANPRVVDLDTGREFQLEGRNRNIPSAVLAKPTADRLITASGAGPIELRNLDGDVLKVLYAGPGEGQ